MRHSISTSPQALFILIQAKLAVPGGKVPVLSHMSSHIPNPPQPCLVDLFVETSGFVGSLDWDDFQSRAVNLNTKVVTLKRRLEEL